MRFERELREHARWLQVRMQAGLPTDQRRMPFEMRRLLPAQREAFPARATGAHGRYVLEMQMRGEFFSTSSSFGSR